MNLATVAAIRSELEAALAGRRFGKVYTLSRSKFVVDFRLPNSQYLLISLEPSSPRIYLITRRLRDVEKLASHPTAFTVFLQKRLAGTIVTSIDQIDGERIVLIRLSGADELGRENSFTLAVQLTGRSANIFLLDENDRILEAARETKGGGQQPGDVYKAPERSGAAPTSPVKESAIQPIDGSYSLALDETDLSAHHAAEMQSAANAARKKIDREVKKLERLQQKLNADLSGHGNADKWKRYGDLLLANAGTPKRAENGFVVTDYYDEAMSELTIETADNLTITEAAEGFFKRYTKARNAGDEISRRAAEVESELADFRELRQRLENAIAAGDESLLSEFADTKKAAPARKLRSGEKETESFARTFVSSDGFEILVGKKAKDNDHLTFRVAKSLDLWMHAADYPGSHVVIRNPNRKEVPSSTLVEAAQLAAFYSRGKTQTKAAVHYTQKKFVNKPRGAAPGLVSLASFKTILVVPKVPDLVERKELR